MNDENRVKATRRTTYTPYNQLKADLGFDHDDHLDMEKFWIAAQSCELARQAKHKVYESLLMRYKHGGSIRRTLREIGEALPVVGKDGVLKAISPQAVSGIMARCRRRMRHPDQTKKYKEQSDG